MSETNVATGMRYLDPAALARLKDLGLAARLVVEGLYAGRHRSPHRGFSVEFAEHRQYTPGVDPRHLDWKILGKRDRLYVKQYEEQTNLRCYLLLDASRSMGYRHDGPMTKFEYACYCTASLAYLMQAQRDAFGLITFAQRVLTHIPPRQGKAHVGVVMETLESMSPLPPDADGQTDLPATLHELAETIKRRALVVVLSDLFSSASDADELLDAIGHLRHRKHEVVVLQVLDPAERTFPFEDAGQIQDVETGRLVAADAQAVRRHYLEAIKQYLDTIRIGCARHDVSYAMTDTDKPFATFLSTYLSRRQHGWT